MKDLFVSPIGTILIQSSEDAIIGVQFIEQEKETVISVTSNDVLDQCKTELAEYFEGIRQNFDVKIFYDTTPFRQQVYQQLVKIPFGSTASYADIAACIGNPKAVRAVGNANHNNPIGILVPCHRVIGKKGDLTGYAGGLWRKEWLLKHEARWKSVK